MDEILEGISNAKKLLDAQNDIKDINNTIRTNYAIQHRASNLYHSLTSEPDYIPYINTFKAKYKMGGDLPFERLGDDGKKQVLSMIGEAIKAYIVDLTRKQ